MSTSLSGNRLIRSIAPDLASFSMTGYNPKDAEGFINLFALPITVPLEAAGAVSALTEGQKMWGGRFERAARRFFYEFERSWHFDRRLLPHELALDRAWARAIAAAGMLTDEEGAANRRGARRNRNARRNRIRHGSTARKPRTSIISRKRR